MEPPIKFTLCKQNKHDIIILLIKKQKNKKQKTKHIKNYRSFYKIEGAIQKKISNILDLNYTLRTLIQ